MELPRGARGPRVNARALRALRLQAGLTQAALADRTGGQVDRSHLSRIEAGIRTNPAPRIVLALARALDVPMDSLLAAEYAEVPG